MLNRASFATPQGRLPAGNAREGLLDRLMRTLDARQRDEEEAGREAEGPCRPPEKGPLSTETRH
eukprot:1535787-Pyramimonas_sp.AAC.1